MRHSLLAVLALGLFACATRSSSTASVQSGDRPRLGPKQVELVDGVHRVPFDLARRGSIPCVEVRVNGGGPYLFLCDTGASLTVIDIELARSLGLALAPAEPLRDPSGAPGVPAWSATLRSLQIGDVMMRDVGVVGTDRAGFDVDKDVRGVLGLPLFERFLVTLDYPKRELRIEKGSLAASGDPDVVEYDASGELPLITLDIDGRAVAAHVDSGSPSGFTLPRKLALELGVVDEPRIIGHARTINGEFDLWGAKLRGSIRLGSHEYASPEVHLNDRFPMANVGYEVLRGYELTIDQAHHRMRFLKVGGEAAAASHGEPRRFGVALEFSPGRVAIQDVMAGGAAERAGLKAGDAIVSIGGRPVSELDPDAISAALHAAGEIRLVVERAGARLEIVVPPMSGS